jgi:hypothetical protein
MTWAVLLVLLAQSRVEIGGGVTWTGGVDAGGESALLSRPSSSAPLTLFETSSRLESAPGVEARAAFFFTPHVGVEGFAGYTRPTLRTTIANDFEGATGDEAVMAIDSYIFGGSVIYRLDGRRLVPFVAAGAGHARQLDDGNVAVASGLELHAGGGAAIALSRHLGLRGDVMFSSREKSLTFDGKRANVPVLRAGLTYRF